MSKFGCLARSTNHDEQGRKVFSLIGLCRTSKNVYLYLGYTHWQYNLWNFSLDLVLDLDI